MTRWHRPGHKQKSPNTQFSLSKQPRESLGTLENSKEHLGIIWVLEETISLPLRWRTMAGELRFYSWVCCPEEWLAGILSWNGESILERERRLVVGSSERVCCLGSHRQNLDIWICCSRSANSTQFSLSLGITYNFFSQDTAPKQWFILSSPPPPPFLISFLK